MPELQIPLCLQGSKEGKKWEAFDKARMLICMPRCVRSVHRDLIYLPEDNTLRGLLPQGGRESPSCVEGTSKVSVEKPEANQEE